MVTVSASQRACCSAASPAPQGVLCLLLRECYLLLTLLHRRDNVASDPDRARNEREKYTCCDGSANVRLGIMDLLCSFESLRIVELSRQQLASFGLN